MIHAGISGATGVDELALDRTESKLLAESVAEVQSFYGNTLDPKIVAWVGLIGVAGSIYGPRIAAIKLRKTLENEQKKADKIAERSMANVAQFSSVMNGG